MSQSVELVHIMRGPMLECVHSGHVAVCTPDGSLIHALGDPGTVILPRSSSKMFQALPLVESGAADAAGLGVRHLALSCASHGGQGIHTELAASWLAGAGFAETDLRCGAHAPSNAAAAAELVRTSRTPDQTHNNCSGKHCGFLTLGRHLKAGPEYIDVSHPVQRAAKAAFEDLIGEASPHHATDGCSAPNFACTLRGLATGAARFAAAEQVLTGTRRSAAIRLRQAMVTHPDLVAGDGRACTELMAAGNGRVVVKTGAEGVFLGMLPDRQLGIAVKISDGATRASECVMAALLVRLGALQAGDPAILNRMIPEQFNCAGRKTGAIKPSDLLWENGADLSPA